MIAARLNPAKNAARREFCAKLALIHDEAHRLGLNETGHLLHAAVQRVGFETAQIEEAIGWPGSELLSMLQGAGEGLNWALDTLAMQCERLVLLGDPKHMVYSPNYLAAVDKTRAAAKSCLDAARSTPLAAVQHERAGGAEDGAGLIAAERARQTEGEFWSAEHDDDHDEEELARAASCYVLPEDERAYSLGGTPKLWPFDESDWKPTPLDRIRELVKAGALIAAEIDRLSRAARSTPQGMPHASENGQ